MHRHMQADGNGQHVHMSSICRLENIGAMSNHEMEICKEAILTQLRRSQTSCVFDIASENVCFVDIWSK